MLRCTRPAEAGPRNCQCQDYLAEVKTLVMAVTERRSSSPWRQRWSTHHSTNLPSKFNSTFNLKLYLKMKRRPMCSINLRQVMLYRSSQPYVTKQMTSLSEDGFINGKNKEEERNLQFKMDPMLYCVTNNDLIIMMTKEMSSLSEDGFINQENKEDVQMQLHSKKKFKERERGCADIYIQPQLQAVTESISLCSSVLLCQQYSAILQHGSRHIYFCVSIRK